MNQERATLISSLAAPIYATLISQYSLSIDKLPTTKLHQLRAIAIQEATSLWLDTLEHE